ncbi:hypothetical protein RRG08_049292 [Elysia crispata]|uniref:Uncharacterized protein n=1 Tax=Elysia crispata TaxID=231223 RepID=A0AAE1E8I1_9GAST|nr:hypothetical protein RRG08_049292 [Elysia crispata]
MVYRGLASRTDIHVDRSAGLSDYLYCHLRLAVVRDVTGDSRRVGLGCVGCWGPTTPSGILPALNPDQEPPLYLEFCLGQTGKESQV